VARGHLMLGVGQAAPGLSQGGLLKGGAACLEAWACLEEGHQEACHREALACLGGHTAWAYCLEASACRGVLETVQASGDRSRGAFDLGASWDSHLVLASFAFAQGALDAQIAEGGPCQADLSKINGWVAEFEASERVCLTELRRLLTWPLLPIGILTSHSNTRGGYSAKLQASSAPGLEWVSQCVRREKAPDLQNKLDASGPLPEQKERCICQRLYLAQFW